MQRLLTLLLVFLALAIIGGSAYLYLSPPVREAGKWGDGSGPVPVDVVSVTLHEFSDRIEAIGTARANESVTLTARVSEMVERIAFEDGGFVDTGDIIVELSKDEELAELDSAQAILREAEQQLERTRDLVSRGNASQATLDERVRIVENARAQVAAVRARIDDRIVRAPFGGVLGLRHVSQGAFVSPGTPITTLDDVTPIKLDFAVPERFLSSLRPRQTVIAKAASYPGETFRGTIIMIDSRVDPVTRAVTVRAEIPNEDARLRPGMLMTVEVLSRERQAIAVPEEALIPVGDMQYVYVVKDDMTAERRQVTLGLRRPGLVEILDGVREGELVVVAGTMRLRPGMAVEIIRRQVPVRRPQA